jgi:hypothetical protein
MVTPEPPRQRKPGGRELPCKEATTVMEWIRTALSPSQRALSRSSQTERNLASAVAG